MNCMSNLIKLIILIIVGGGGFLYITFYWGIYEPIIAIGEMLDTGNVGFADLAYEVVKIALKEVVGLIWLFVCATIASITLED